MTKQVSVTFEFDPETELVSNVHAFVDGIEKKKKTTRKVSTKEEIIEDVSLVIREDNRLVFNNKCYKEMDLDPENRIIIKYEQVGNDRFPIIGSDLAFDQEGSGNKISKTKTVPYRGKANLILSEYGTTFTIEAYKDNIWKLVSTIPVDVVPRNYEEVVKKAENLDINIYTTDDDKIEIDEITFSL